MLGVVPRRPRHRPVAGPARPEAHAAPLPGSRAASEAAARFPPGRGRRPAPGDARRRDCARPWPGAGGDVSSRWPMPPSPCPRSAQAGDPAPPARRSRSSIAPRHSRAAGERAAAPTLCGDRLDRAPHGLEDVTRQALDPRQQALHGPLRHLLSEHEAPLLAPVLKIGRPVLATPCAPPGDRESACCIRLRPSIFAGGFRGAFMAPKTYDAVPGLTRPFPGAEIGVNITLV